MPAYFGMKPYHEIENRWEEKLTLWQQCCAVVKQLKSWIFNRWTAGAVSLSLTLLMVGGLLFLSPAGQVVTHAAAKNVLEELQPNKTAVVEEIKISKDPNRLRPTPTGMVEVKAEALPPKTSVVVTRHPAERVKPLVEALVAFAQKRRKAVLTETIKVAADGSHTIQPTKPQVATLVPAKVETPAEQELQPKKVAVQKIVLLPKPQVRPNYTSSKKEVKSALPMPTKKLKRSFLKRVFG